MIAMLLTSLRYHLQVYVTSHKYVHQYWYMLFPITRVYNTKEYTSSPVRIKTTFVPKKEKLVPNCENLLLN